MNDASTTTIEMKQTMNAKQIERIVYSTTCAKYDIDVIALTLRDIRCDVTTQQYNDIAHSLISMRERIRAIERTTTNDDA